MRISDWSQTCALPIWSDLDVEKVQDGFAVFNGRIGLYGRDRRWGIELWGQNLFNKRYYQIGADMPLQGSGSFRSVAAPAALGFPRSEEHTSELQSLMRISYAVFCLKQKTKNIHK